MSIRNHSAIWFAAVAFFAAAPSFGVYADEAKNPRSLVLKSVRLARTIGDSSLLERAEEERELQKQIVRAEVTQGLSAVPLCEDPCR